MIRVTRYRALLKLKWSACGPELGLIEVERHASRPSLAASFAARLRSCYLGRPGDWRGKVSGPRSCFRPASSLVLFKSCRRRIYTERLQVPCFATVGGCCVLVKLSTGARSLSAVRPGLGWPFISVCWSGAHTLLRQLRWPSPPQSTPVVAPRVLGVDDWARDPSADPSPAYTSCRFQYGSGPSAS